MAVLVFPAIASPPTGTSRRSEPKLPSHYFNAPSLPFQGDQAVNHHIDLRGLSAAKLPRIRGLYGRRETH